MPVLSCLCTCTLVLFNTLFLLIGLVLAGLGGVLRFHFDVIKNIIKGVLEQLEKVMSQHNMGKINLTDMIMDFASTIGTVLLIVGCVIGIIALVGIVGACCRIKIVIYVYIAILSIIVIVQIVMMVLWDSNKTLLLENVTRGLQETIRKEYEGDLATNTLSKLWTLANFGLKCCGLNNYTDFEKANKWNRTIDISKLDKSLGFVQNQIVKLKYPISCCKMDDNYQMKDSQKCIDGSMNKDFTNAEIGCVSKVVGLLEQSDKYVNAVGWSAIGVQLLIILFAVLTVCLVGLDKKLSPV